MSEELINTVAKRFGRDPMTVAKCSWCNGGRTVYPSGLIVPCNTCKGNGVVCNLCREPLALCRCNGVLALCKGGCGRVPAACNCSTRKEFQ